MKAALPESSQGLVSAITRLSLDEHGLALGSRNAGLDKGPLSGRGVWNTAMFLPRLAFLRGTVSSLRRISSEIPLD